VIRDDDLCYFTKPELLEKVYAGIWTDFPITFGAIPYLKGSPAGFVPPEYWHFQEPLMLHKNNELIDYIKPHIATKRVDVALHGIHHQYRPSRNGLLPELRVAMPNFEAQVLEAKQYLEILFNQKINVFIPPSNTMSSKAAMTLKRLGFHLLNLPGVKQRSRPLFSPQYTLARLQRIYFHVRHGFDSPIPLKINHLWEIGSHVLTPGIDLNHLKKAFLYSYDHGYPFVLATHYWEHASYLPHHSKSTQYDLLRTFLDFVSQYKINPITASELVCAV